VEDILFFVANLGLFFFAYVILTVGLNIQFGYAGLLNFAYITFWAIGAYVTGVLILGPAPGHGITYILGFNLPFLVALIAGGVAAGALAALMGALILRRLRSDFVAIGLFALSFALYDIVGNYTPLFNGWDGILGVLPPLNIFQLDANAFTIYYLVPVGLATLILYWAANLLQNSPYGRALRAVRDDIDVAASFGKNTVWLRWSALVIGCIYAGIAGGLMIGFLSALSPASWASSETFIIWAALIVGGAGNNRGMLLGTFLFVIVALEATRLIPMPANVQNLIPALRLIVIGAVLIVVLLFRPQGLLPERRRIYALPGQS